MDVRHGRRDTDIAASLVTYRLQAADPPSSEPDLAHDGNISYTE